MVVNNLVGYIGTLVPQPHVRVCTGSPIKDDHQKNSIGKGQLLRESFRGPKASCMAILDGQGSLGKMIGEQINSESDSGRIIPIIGGYIELMSQQGIHLQLKQDHTPAYAAVETREDLGERGIIVIT